MNLTPLRWAAVAVSLACAGSSAYAQKARYATFLPDGEPFVAGLKKFSADVSSATQGRVDFSIHAGGSLLGISELIEGIADGRAEGGVVVPTWAKDTLSHVKILGDLMAFSTNSMQSSASTMETMLLDCPECLTDYAEIGITFVSSLEPPPYWLQCNRKVRKPADLVGIPIGAKAQSSLRWIESLGAKPLRMTYGEMLPALLEGRVNCVLATPNWLHSFGLSKTVSHVVTTPQGAYQGVGMFAFNRAFFDSLEDDDVGTIVRSAIRRTAEVLVDVNAGRIPEALQETIADKRIEIVSNNVPFSIAWARYQKREPEYAIAQAIERGIDEAVARRIVSAHLENIKKWGEITNEVGADADQFEAALWEHIYSKVTFRE